MKKVFFFMGMVLFSMGLGVQGYRLPRTEVLPATGVYSDAQWCCSYHNWLSYIATNGVVVCGDGTTSECYSTYRWLCVDYPLGDYNWSAESLRGSSNLTDSQRSAVNSAVLAHDKLTSFLKSISNRAWWTLSTSLQDKRDALTEYQYRNLICSAEYNVYIQSSNISSNYNSVSTILTDMEKDKVDYAIKMWDKQANAWIYHEAISYYNDAIAILQDKVEFNSLVAQLKEAIKNLETKQKTSNIVNWLKKQEKERKELTSMYNEALEYWKKWDYESAIYRLKNIIKKEWSIDWWDNYKLAKEALKIYEEGLAKINNLQKQEDESEILKVKIALWDKAEIIESIAKLLKMKDTQTQKKAEVLCEKFKNSKDEYTRNIWIYLGYLMQ